MFWDVQENYAIFKRRGSEWNDHIYSTLISHVKDLVRVVVDYGMSVAGHCDAL